MHPLVNVKLQDVDHGTCLFLGFKIFFLRMQRFEKVTLIVGCKIFGVSKTFLGCQIFSGHKKLFLDTRNSFFGIQKLFVGSNVFSGHRSFLLTKIQKHFLNYKE